MACMLMSSTMEPKGEDLEFSMPTGTTRDKMAVGNSIQFHAILAYMNCNVLQTSWLAQKEGEAPIQELKARLSKGTEKITI